MTLTELRLFQSIRVGRLGEENFFNAQRPPGIVMVLHDGYVEVTVDGAAVCTPMQNVRSFVRAFASSASARSELPTEPELPVKRGPGRPPRVARVQMDGAVKIERDE
jgi:hypothetical protein